MIHLALGKLCQQRIGLFFLFKALVQHLLVFTQVELASQGRSSAVRRDLVMFEEAYPADSGPTKYGDMRRAVA